MTKEELIRRLEDVETTHNEDGSIRDAGDWHADADHLLLEYINDKSVTEAFNDITKWYA